MNPNYGYQLYQAQRVTPHAEILAADARRGQQAATISRGTRRVARTALGPLISRAYRRRSLSWV
jgi:hypothetical protein